MTETSLRREIKKAVDGLPAERLPSVADFIAFLNRPGIDERIALAERDLKAGKGVAWRQVRDDV